MGARNSISFLIPLEPAQCFSFLASSGARIDKYELVDSSQTNQCLTWRKGMGWTNPISVRVELRGAGSAQTEVHMTAEIGALVDPFNFTTKALGIFEQNIRKLLTSSSLALTGNNGGASLPVTPARYRLSGVDRETKMDTTWYCEADSPENAKVKGELEGIVVTKVERA